ncbi:hypothetical protein A1351_08565 [Methylosinus sp. R-45379]|uniref:DUF6680 family protein n=1 Tax=Methylosinus sp. R-45379 TaxID=980563 RepID=UPI0007C96A28|nr:DUF6680 family protein [Methylosinus sp. R-45379]OAI30544.1 hypothetical protein A1351_08565 [Methylosinus sp. R-45379]
MTFETFAVVFATLLGPILAVQAQKMIERISERRRQKQEVFRSLMVTRGSRVSFEHVRALNSIDIVFSQNDKKENKVIKKWRIYAFNLNQNVQDASEAALATWVNKNDELFLDLMEAMALALGVPAEREHLAGAYLPKAHFDTAQAQQRALSSIARVFSGEQPLKMDVTSFPASPEAVSRQEEIQKKLLLALGDGEMNVHITNQP